MVRITMVLVSLTFGVATCNSFADGAAKNVKDLDENMIDLRVYHENLGDAIMHRNQDNALWLETGMDSVLRVVAGKFDEHRKLTKPFRETYEKELKPPIDQMHRALEKNSWAEAEQSYTVLTKKCNGCHQDHDVDKEVQNWLKR